MLRTVSLLGIAFVLSCCARSSPLNPEPLDLRSSWDSGDDLRFWLVLDTPTQVASETIPIALHVARNERARGKSASLLAGRFVFTFVPINPAGGSVHARCHTFSGAGGVDYSGGDPLEFEVLAPSVPGRYWLYATVQSSPDDVRGFLMTARVTANAGPWWRGNQSTRPVLVEIEAAGVGRAG